jgi:high-affinity Fe2+/Pb2+ permease
VVLLLVVIGVIALSLFDRSRRALGGAVAGALGAVLIAALLATGGYSIILGRPFVAVAAVAIALLAARSWWTSRGRAQRSDGARNG